MNNIWLIAQRELLEKIKTRSFILMALIGPMLVLGLLYLLFSFGVNEKQQFKVLVMDKYGLLEGKLMANPDPRFQFDFVNEFIDYDEFAQGEAFQSYDLNVWINEKIFTNKTIIISYREAPSESIKRRLTYHLERRLDEIMVAQFTNISIAKFREIKQPLNVSFKNTYDPKSETSYLAGWVGFIFGAFILFFIFLFGMTILRSVSKEKANRIVELLVAAVRPRTLLTGKVIGIGLSAFLQFVCWIVIIGAGLFLFRNIFFPDYFDPSVLANQIGAEGTGLSKDAFGFTAYNDFVDLVYRKIQFGTMLVFFLLFFVGGFLFYGAFFAMIGASMGSESDGQQYVIPLTLLLLAALLAGYYSIYFPTHSATTTFVFVPFTAPIASMVLLGNGFEHGGAWQLFFSLFLLYSFAFIFLFLAGRVYQNGILQFGHRLRWRLLMKWIKKS